MALRRPTVARVMLYGVLALALVGGGLAVFKRARVRTALMHVPFIRQLFRKKTVEEQVAVYGNSARNRLQVTFAKNGLPYPPSKVALVAVKDTAVLELYAGSQDGKYVFVRRYPILGASGVLGPKLRFGDCQVPEGIYRVESLEPNTPYHLGLRVNYPNAFDRARAAEDGRTNLGGDILIHGSTGSVGCLAMGDETSEDLFIVVADAADKDVPLIMAPVDFRKVSMPNPKEGQPRWLPRLYKDIDMKLKSYPLGG